MQLVHSSTVFKPISRQTFSKFKKIRKINSALMGEHYLYTRDNVRYVVKQLPSDQEFHTSRPLVFNFFKYVSPDQSMTSYVYPILGLAIAPVVQSGFNHFTKLRQKSSRNDPDDGKMSAQLKEYNEWILRNNGSLERALMEVIKCLVRTLLQNDLGQPFLECVRIINGQIIYCYDTWMNTNSKIITNHFQELENLFLSPKDLKEISREAASQILNEDIGMTFTFNRSKKYSKKSNPQDFDHQNHHFTEIIQQDSIFLNVCFKVCLLALKLGSYELKLRNYEWSELSINQQNIQERINYFKLRYHKQNLSQIFEVVLLNTGAQNTQFISLWLHQLIFGSQRKLSSNSSKQLDGQSRLSFSHSNSISLSNSNLKDSSNKKRITLGNSNIKSNVIAERYNLTKPCVTTIDVAGIKGAVNENMLLHQSCSDNHLVGRSSYNSKSLKKSSKLSTNQKLYSSNCRLTFSDSKSNLQTIKKFRLSASTANVNNRSFHKKNNSLISKNQNDSFHLISKVKAPQRIKCVKLNSSNKKDTQLTDGSESFLIMSEVNTQKQNKKQKNSFDLRDSILSAQINQHSGNFKILSFLNLQEYIPQSKYEENTLKYLQNAWIRQSFKQKVYPNRSVYLGDLQYIDNQQTARDGMGLYIFPSNDIYYGKWKNNEINGMGTYIFRSGDVYIGQLKAGSKHGFGWLLYSDGKTFQGNWKNDQKVGLGVVSFPNKVRFMGNFVPSKLTEGVFTGENPKTWKRNGYLQNYNFQTNTFVDCQSTPQSKVQYLEPNRIISSQKQRENENSQVYAYNEQETVGQMKNGFGCEQNELQIYQGSFINDSRQGKGTLKVKNNFEIKGTWKQGMMINYQSDL